MFWGIQMEDKTINQIQDSLTSMESLLSKLVGQFERLIDVMNLIKRDVDEISGFDSFLYGESERGKFSILFGNVGTAVDEINLSVGDIKEKINPDSDWRD